MSCLHRVRLYIAPVMMVCLCASCAVTGPESGVERRDMAFVQAASAARLAYDRGNFSQARDLYRRALTRARAVNDAGLAADSAYNMALSEIGLGNYDSADELLRQAYYDAERAKSNTADIQLVRAKVAFLRERHREALTLLDGIREAQTANSVYLQARMLSGLIFCEDGDLDAAKSELAAIDRFISASKADLPPAIGADRAKLAGTVASLEENMLVAARSYDREAELLRVAKRYRDMGYALGRAAEAHLAAGGPGLAADRYFLAARSLLAQGDIDAAQSMLASSLSAAEIAGDQGARRRAQVLLDSISRRSDP